MSITHNNFIKTGNDLANDGDVIKKELFSLDGISVCFRYEMDRSFFLNAQMRNPSVAYAIFASLYKDHEEYRDMLSQVVIEKAGAYTSRKDELVDMSYSVFNELIVRIQDDINQSNNMLERLEQHYAIEGSDNNFGVPLDTYHTVYCRVCRILNSYVILDLIPEQGSSTRKQFIVNILVNDESVSLWQQAEAEYLGYRLVQWYLENPIIRRVVLNSVNFSNNDVMLYSFQFRKLVENMAMTIRNSVKDLVEHAG